jgi:hypothetical protein
MTTDASPALLTKTELDWLQHKIKVSKVYEYRLRSDIKKKLGTFRQLELPLLMKNGFISSNDDLSAYTQSLSSNPQSLESSNKAKRSKPWPGFGPGTFALPRLNSLIATTPAPNPNQGCHYHLLYRDDYH